ncbi:MAG: FkbM family methyltransferase [Planctomycetes bacterium]|nr:FkbM family methyltransferase [Planctomycetota bacterium]
MIGEVAGARLRELLNRGFAALGLRCVNASWGPVGFSHSVRKIRRAGWSPRQVVDVGAARGEWTIECRRVFPDAAYLLIEPLPDHAAGLADLARRIPRVRVWSGAVGATDGTVAIRCHGDQSSMLVANDAQFRGSDREVPLRTLDSLVVTGELLRPDLVKLDVQGYELEVLRGAASVLEHAQVLLVELSFRRLYADQPLAHEVIAFLGQRDFRIADICTYSQRARDAALLQSDVLFVKEGLLPSSDDRFF